MNSIVPATAAGIVCARCSTFRDKVRHASVAAVRLCQTAPSPAVDMVPVGGSWSGTSEPAAVVPLTSLPPVPGAYARKVAAAAAAETRNEAAAAAAAKAAAPVAADVVPAGRYAVRGMDGVVKFYVVDHGRAGSRWDGHVFVSVQAGDELHAVRDRARRIGILAAILADPRAASALYGRELGRCGVCNRTLTDPESIAAGIGPVCAGRF